MSRADQQETTGQAPYDLGRCTCGDLEAVHTLNDAGERRACTASTCRSRCKRFTVVSVQVSRWPGD